MSKVRIGRIDVRTGPIDVATANTLRRTLPAALASLEATGPLQVERLVVDLTGTRPLTSRGIVAGLSSAIAAHRRWRS